jgi:hypothetical protein
MTMNDFAFEIQRAIGRLPLILTILALFLLTALQTAQSFRDRATLQTVRAGQDATIQNAIRLRHEMDALAGKTAKLAAEGDEGAKSVVAFMKQQGVVLTQPPQQ